MSLLALTAERLHRTDRHRTKTRRFTSLMRPPAVRLRRLVPRSLTEKISLYPSSVCTLSQTRQLRDQVGCRRSVDCDRRIKSQQCLALVRKQGVCGRVRIPGFSPQAGLSHEMEIATSEQGPAPPTPQRPLLLHNNWSVGRKRLQCCVSGRQIHTNPNFTEMFFFSGFLIHY